VAELVKRYAAPLLRDDPACDSAFEIQSERANQYVKEVNLKRVRSKAGAAWQAKDYAQVVELFHSVRKHLTEVEAKKLA